MQAKPSAPEKSAAEIALAKKVEDETCKKDLRCIGDKMMLTAGLRCKQPIEKYAKYSFNWTDGMFEPKFSRFKWRDPSRKVITEIGDKIQFQNGFGAMQNHIYYCDIDIETGNVLGVRVATGKIQ